MSCTCDCCTGAHVATPAAEENRPGLCRISHHPGTYATFFETMQARLSSSDFPELAALRMRDAGDPSIALCDAWAIAADVLSFYQDRIANEGYLRTATERNSLLQLGRLTGYQLRPGVSASAYLAYTLDANATNVDIAVGTRVQSVPGTGEKMQTFETAEPLSARSEWSEISVRLSQPQWRAPQAINDTKADYADRYNVLARGNGLYLAGTNTQLHANDALLIDYGSGMLTPYRVDAVTPDADNQRTKVELRGWNAATKGSGTARAPALAAAVGEGPSIAGAAEPGLDSPQSRVATVVGELGKAAAQVQPRSALTLARDIASTLRPGGEAFSRLLLAHVPMLRDTLGPALQSANVTSEPPAPIKVYALRVRAAAFGNTAPGQIVLSVTGGANPSVAYENLSLVVAWKDLTDAKTEAHTSRLPLDATYDRIAADKPEARSYALVDAGVPAFEKRAGGDWPRIVTVLDNRAVAMSIGQSISARVSQLTIEGDWLKSNERIAAAVAEGNVAAEVAFLRRAVVLAGSEELALAADPLIDDVSGDMATSEIELDKYYGGLTPGMWVIAGGERADFTDPAVHVRAAERAMIAAVRHGLTALISSDAEIKPANLPNDTVHTFVKLATPLTYSYRRSTFTLYGNVMRATHGQTNQETLGSGDATQTFQRFALKSPPLTYVSAPTPDGIASTLQVRANNLLWHETNDLGSADANARDYRTRRDAGEATGVMFGDGKHGARLPTGQGNITAVYRNGIGFAGNVRAGQLTVLADKPLGVTAVSNPLRASGGADADTLAQARVNAPIAVTALDRLVSVQDYADFACNFAGIGKAASIKLPGPGGDFVHLTIAGIDDAPIDTTSDLYVNLDEALHDFGDPHLPIRIDMRIALSLVIQAKVALLPDYLWSDVQPKIQAALYARFGFQARSFGQPVFASEIITTIQSVRGVAHVLGGTVSLLDYDNLVAGLTPMAPGADTGGAAASPAGWFSLTPVSGATDEGDGTPGWLTIPSASADRNGKARPAQIAYLPANVPEALILEVAS
jgi:hypothetical protein